MYAKTKSRELKRRNENDRTTQHSCGICTLTGGLANGRQKKKKKKENIDFVCFLLVECKSFARDGAMWFRENELTIPNWFFHFSVRFWFWFFFSTFFFCFFFSEWRRCKHLHKSEFRLSKSLANRLTDWNIFDLNFVFLFSFFSIFSFTEAEQEESNDTYFYWLAFRREGNVKIDAHNDEQIMTNGNLYFFSFIFFFFYVYFSIH